MMPARLALAVAAAVLCLLATAARPVPAAAAEKAIWGPLDLPGGDPAFPLYRSLGVDTYQFLLDWSKVAPARPTRPADPGDPAYRWPRALERAVADAARQRIRLAVLVTRSPAWANGGRSPLWAPDPAAFAQFLATTSRRYPSVRRWMIWGEPNLGDRFQPNQADTPASARAYAPLLDAAYAALKAVSRRNTVIGGMTWSGGDVKPASFLGWLRLPNGQPPRLDWYGHNPFPFRFPNLRNEAIGGGWRDISDLDVFSREVRRSFRRIHRRPRLWLSEFTVQSDHVSNVFQLYVSRQEQARWLAAGYRIADRLPSVAGLGWFTLLDQPEGRLSASLGLMTASGSRKPAFSAFSLAPSRVFRPSVRAPRRARPGTRSLVVRVRPKAAGRAVVRLARRGRTVRRRARRLKAGRASRIRLGRTRLHRGRYEIIVSAQRGERVVRRLAVL